MENKQPPYFTVHQAIATGPIGRTKLYEMMNDGIFPALKLGRKTIIPSKEFLEAMANLPRYQPRARAQTPTILPSSDLREREASMASESGKLKGEPRLGQPLQAAQPAVPEILEN